MQISSLGRKLIESFESLRLEAYQDQRGIWTIGYGHTLGVVPGQTCTQTQADLYMSDDLSVVENCLNSAIKIQVNQNQFDALGSLTYNIGTGAFEKSHLLQFLNWESFDLASDQFLIWDHEEGKTDRGLLNRRIKEKQLFDTPMPEVENADTSS